MKKIYSTLWGNNQFDLSKLDYLTDTIDLNSLHNYFKHDRIKSFPYKMPNIEILFELLQQKYNILENDIILSKDLSNHCFVFEIKREIEDMVVLSLYSRINKARIIDKKINIEVFSSKYLINKIEVLKNNPYIFKIEHIDTQYHYYVSRRAKMIIKRCNQELFYPILQLIYNFNSYNINLDFNNLATKCPFVPLNVHNIETFVI